PNAYPLPQLLPPPPPIHLARAHPPTGHQPRPVGTRQGRHRALRQDHVSDPYPVIALVEEDPGPVLLPLPGHGGRAGRYVVLVPFIPRESGIYRPKDKK